MPDQKALARRDEATSIAAPLNDLEALSAKFQALERHANLVTPLAKVDYMLPMHQVSLRQVFISPRPDDQETYEDKRFCKRGEVAFGKLAITKLLGAANVSVHERRRVDDRSNPNKCEIEVTLAMRMFDGQVRYATASKESDFTDGAPELLKPEWACNAHNSPECTQCDQGGGRWRKTGRSTQMDESAVNDKRRHIVSLTETKALLRAARVLLNIKQKYSVEDLKKPFIVPVLVPDLDPGDPDTKQRLLDVALGATGKAYGAQHEQGVRRALAAHAGVDIDQDDLPFGPASPEENASGGGGLTAKPAQDEAAPEEPEPSPAENGAAGGDDFPEIPAADSAPPITCECPCGDQTEVNDTAAAMTRERGGAVRCAACWPGRHFDYESHAELPTLGLPSRPDLTPAQARELARRARGGGR